MSNDEIKVSDGDALSSDEVHIAAARPSGFIAWYRWTDADYFNQVFQLPNIDLNRDHWRCPLPLFPTREDAIAAAKYALRERGGEVRIVKVIL